MIIGELIFQRHFSTMHITSLCECRGRDESAFKHRKNIKTISDSIIRCILLKYFYLFYRTRKTTDKSKNKIMTLRYFWNHVLMKKIKEIRHRAFPLKEKALFTGIRGSKSLEDNVIGPCTEDEIAIEFQKGSLCFTLWRKITKEII